MVCTVQASACTLVVIAEMHQHNVSQKSFDFLFSIIFGPIFTIVKWERLNQGHILQLILQLEFKLCQENR